MTSSRRSSRLKCDLLPTVKHKRFTVCHSRLRFESPRAVSVRFQTPRLSWARQMSGLRGSQWLLIVRYMLKVVHHSVAPIIDIVVPKKGHLSADIL